MLSPEVTMSTWYMAENPFSSDLVTEQQEQGKEAELLVPLGRTSEKWRKIPSFSSVFPRGQKLLLYGLALPILITETLGFY